MEQLHTQTTEVIERQIEPTDTSKHNSISLGTIVLLAGIALVAAVFALALARQNQGQPTQGAAPDFELTTFDGQTFRLSDLRGNIVVLNFWAGWCGPCRDEAPALQAAWEQYRDQGVVFMGVAWADNGPSSLAFIEEFGITYFNGPDTGTRISEDYNIQGVPETFFIDQNGNIVNTVFMPMSAEELTAILDDMLASAGA